MHLSIYPCLSIGISITHMNGWLRACDESAAPAAAVAAEAALLIYVFI